MKKTVSVLMALMTAVVLLLSGCVFAEGGSDGELETMLSRMTLREKVAQMMIASFRVWQEVPEAADGAQSAGEAPKTKITELNDEIREMVAREHFGGILLFGENFTDPEQTLKLVSDLQTTNRDGGGVPQLIFVDQEGGSVNRIPYSTIGVSNMALGATGDPENTRRMAAIHGEEIGLLGIGVDFAPVMDVNSNATNPVIGIRSFSDDPQTVAAHGCAYLAGLHDAGIIAALKHFPGHGNTDTDSHTGFPLINSTYEELKANELIPFQAAIDAGADMVMTAHIQYPQIEKETYVSVSTGEQVYLPATMSRTILTGILREDMGFDGLIVTDALDMAAIKDNFTLEDTVKMTINAGVDLLILPAVQNTSLFRMTETYVDTAAALVESGEIDEARIDESVLRILKLKARYGILDQSDFTVTDERIAAARNGVGSAEHRETERQIAGNALTLVKNENDAFPLQVKPGEKTLIIFADSCASRAGTGDLARQMLEEKQALPEGAEITVMKSTGENGDVCVLAALGADHVILVHRVYNQACLDPATDDGFSSGVFDRVIDALHQKGKPVIVVSCQLPYDAARFPEADAILLTYWGSAMKELPAEGASWSANLPEGLLACFGQCEAKGKLPVDIPALDEAYRPTGEILWRRGSTASGAAEDPLAQYRLEQVVVLSRHNLRAPLSSNGSVPAELTPHSWIEWSAGSSELTLKGGIEETSMGQYFRKWLAEEGLFEENAVPKAGEVRFNARDKQRCRATAKYFAAGMLPTADTVVEHPGDDAGTEDFMSPALHFYSEQYADAATAQVAAMGGAAGFDGIAEQNRDVIRLIMETVDMRDSAAYRSGKYGDLLADGFGYTMAADQEPDLTGAIRPAYQVADALILQYYESPDATEAAFGHALTDGDWAELGKFMTTCLEIKHGAPLVALNITNPLIRELKGELENKDRKFSFFCAHDCTVLGTLTALGAEDYALPDSIETKTPIGVKVLFERWRDSEGRAWYRVNLVYRSTEQIRSGEMLTLDNPPLRYDLSFEGVETNADGLISEADLLALFDRTLDAYDQLEEQYGAEIPDAAAETAAEGGLRTSREIIEEMAVYYGTYGDEADGKTAELLGELSAADPDAGAKWQSIMRLWKTAGTDPEINENILPDGLPDTDELCLVVLGFQLNPDGSMKDELIERLKVAKASAEKYPNALVVCTGGGTAAENPDATEAGEMAKWLTANGLDAGRVIVEDRSLTTAQNAIYTWQILAERYPQVKQLAIISSDYHIATGVLLFGAEATLQAGEAGEESMTVVSNAAWHAPSGTLSAMFQAGALIELSGDVETAFDIYYETYDIHELPALDKGDAGAPGSGALQAVRDRGVLRVGTAGDYKPMSFLDPETGTYWGFDTELAEDLAASLGVGIEYVPTSWPTLMEDTLAGKFDLAICGITVTDARKEQALMSDGYLENGKTVLCRAEDADRYTSLEAINRPEVRVMENPGGLNEKFARENLPDAALVIHDVNQEIPGLVASGEADVMITEVMEAGYYVGQDSRLATPLIYEPFTNGQLGVLMPKGSEDLLEAVNGFLAEEKANGRLDELAEKYIYRYITTEEEERPAA